MYSFNLIRRACLAGTLNKVLGKNLNLLGMNEVVLLLVLIKTGVKSFLAYVTESLTKEVKLLVPNLLTS